MGDGETAALVAGWSCGLLAGRVGCWLTLACCGMPPEGSTSPASRLPLPGSYPRYASFPPSYPSPLARPRSCLRPTFTKKKR